MAKKIYVVEGRQFRTENDYRLALKDKQIIDQLRKKVDFSDRKQLSQLIHILRENKIQFHTILGQDFLEETEEILNQLTKQQEKPKKSGEKTNSDFDKYVQEELKRRDKRRRYLAFICSIVGIVCLGYFSIYAYQTIRTQRNFQRLAEIREQEQGSQYISESTSSVIHFTESSEMETPKILDEYKNLYNVNKRLIGWLKIDDTKIDYPVMQTTNNEYFLDHNIDQQYDKNGALFLDKDCNVLTPSTNLIIYGHHMKNGNMFGTLDKYSSEDYYKEHPIIRFDSIYEKGLYEIMYVFRSRIYNEEDVVFKYYQFIDAMSEQEFESNMQEMAAISLYDTGVTASYGDRLLTLSTCDYYVEDGRFVVVAKRIEE